MSTIEGELDACCQKTKLNLPFMTTGIAWSCTDCERIYLPTIFKIKEGWQLQYVQISPVLP